MRKGPGESWCQGEEGSAGGGTKRGWGYKKAGAAIDWACDEAREVQSWYLALPDASIQLMLYRAVQGVESACRVGIVLNQRQQGVHLQRLGGLCWLPLHWVAAAGAGAELQICLRQGGGGHQAALAVLLQVGANWGPQVTRIPWRLVIRYVGKRDKQWA